MERQAFDPLQAAQNAQAWLAADGCLSGVGLEQIVGGDIESLPRRKQDALLTTIDAFLSSTAS